MLLPQEYIFKFSHGKFKSNFYHKSMDNIDPTKAFLKMTNHSSSVLTKVLTATKSTNAEWKGKLKELKVN